MPIVDATACVAVNVFEARIYRRSATSGGDAKHL